MFFSRRSPEDCTHLRRCLAIADLENQMRTRSLVEAQRLNDSLEKRLRDTQAELDRYVAATAVLARDEIEAMHA